MKWVAKRRRQRQKEAKHGEVVEKQRAGETRSSGTRGSEQERGVKNENRDGADIEQTCTHSIQIS